MISAKCIALLHQFCTETRETCSCPSCHLGPCKKCGATELMKMFDGLCANCERDRVHAVPFPGTPCSTCGKLGAYRMPADRTSPFRCTSCWGHDVVSATDGQTSRSTHDLAPPSEDVFQRLALASTPLPVTVADLVAPGIGEKPQPNDIWRVGGSEALLVWVRQVFDDGIADVVPLVLDVELADEHSVFVAADATPLGVSTVALVALRTHLHPAAFINRIGHLELSREVAEVQAAVREGRRPSGVPVGPPIDDDGDQRLEYRQALRDLLTELSPSGHTVSDTKTVTT